MSDYTSFSSFAELCLSLEKTASRLEKRRLVAGFLRTLKPDEIKPAVCFLIGKASPEAEESCLEVGERTLLKIRTYRQSALNGGRLSILGVSKAFASIASESGPGSKRRRENILSGLLNQATPLEAEYLVRLLAAEMRVGAGEGVVAEAVAEASGADLGLVTRANMLLGSLGDVAHIALTQGAVALGSLGLRLFSPVKPMLAETSYDISEALKNHGGRTAFEWKFDGARVQIHKNYGEVRIFSRRLIDVTESLPEIVQLSRGSIHAESALVDGEVVAVGPDGKPLPFQDLMRRFHRLHMVEDEAQRIPLRLYLFDILYVDGRTLIDAPYSERWDTLLQTVDKPLLSPRIVTSEPAEAERFLSDALRAGHEGLMAKALDSNYSPGARGKKWYKIKPFETLDLVVIAAEWGHGRRKGWLSNYHLGALDERAGEYLSLGKTFKGLTDGEFRSMTERLQALKIKEDGYTVYVKPSIVVEAAYNEIQRSPKYKSGFALRFARITRIREDKRPEDADTVSRVAELYRKQFRAKSRLNHDPAQGSL